jgi:hypothetical protein
MLRNVSPAERLKLLCELVRLCFADGNLDKPLKVTEDTDSQWGVLAMFPRTTGPYTDLTPEEDAEIQRRIDIRHNAISHGEFVKRVRKRLHALPESERS